METTDRIDKLGVYFVHFKIRERFNLTFEEFVNKVDNGSWEVMVNESCA